MPLCQLHDEAALAGTDLQMEGFVIAEKVFPGSALFFGFLHDPGTGGNRVPGAGYIS